MTSNSQTRILFAGFVFGTLWVAAPALGEDSHVNDGAAAIGGASSRGIRQSDLLDIFRRFGDLAFQRFRNFGEARLESLRQSFDVIEKTFTPQKAGELIGAFKPGAPPSPQLDKLDRLLKETRLRWSAIQARARDFERQGLSRDEAFKKALRFAASADDENELYGNVVDRFADGLSMDPEDLLDQLARLEKEPPKNEAENARLLGLLIAQRFYLANGGADFSKKAHISQRSAILMLFGSKGSPEVKSTAKVLLAKLPQLSPSERNDILKEISLNIKFGEAANLALYGDSDPTRLPGSKYGNALLMAHALKVFAKDDAQRSLLERGNTDPSTRKSLLKLVAELAEGALPSPPRDNRLDPQAIAEGAKHLRDHLNRGVARIRERKARGGGAQGDRDLLDAGRAFDDALDAVDDRRRTSEGSRNRDRSESDLLVGVPEWMCAVAVARVSRGAQPSEALRRDCAREFAEAGIDVPSPPAGGNPNPGGSSGENGGLAGGTGGIGRGLGGTGSSASAGGGSNASAGGRPATAPDDATDADRLDGSARSLFARRDDGHAWTGVAGAGVPPSPPAQPSAPVAQGPAPAVTREPLILAPAVAESPPIASAPASRGELPSRTSDSRGASNDHDVVRPPKDEDGSVDVLTVAGSADDPHGRKKGFPGSGNGQDDDELDPSRRLPAALTGNGGMAGSSAGGTNSIRNGAAPGALTTGGYGNGGSSGSNWSSTWWNASPFAQGSGSSSSSEDSKFGSKNGASEGKGWNVGMIPKPGMITPPRPLFAPELGQNLLWRERNGFAPQAGEENSRFLATDLRPSRPEGAFVDLPGTAPIAMIDLGPARETVFARKDDLLLGQAELLQGKLSGKLPDGRTVEILRIAEIDPGIRENDPKSLIGRTVRRRTIVKVVERDGTTKTFTTTFDERYVPGPGGNPMAVKLAERIEVVEEAKGKPPVRRRIERTFALDSAGKPMQVASNETLLDAKGNPIKVREDKVVVSGTREKRRSTTFYELEDWKKRVFELDQQVAR